MWKVDLNRVAALLIAVAVALIAAAPGRPCQRTLAKPETACVYGASTAVTRSAIPPSAERHDAALTWSVVPVAVIAPSVSTLLTPPSHACAAGASPRNSVLRI